MPWFPAAQSGSPTPSGFNMGWTGTLEERREKQRLASRRWREAHPEQAKESARMSARRQRLRDPARIKRQNRYSRAKINHGLSRAELDAMYQMQDGACGICEAPEEGRLLAIDHNHQTGEVRMLLCHNCNRAIGWMQDDPDRLRAAADYLEAHA